MATSSHLTPAEREVVKLLGIKPDEFASAKIAHHAREHTSYDCGSDAEQVRRAFGIKEDDDVAIPGKISGHARMPGSVHKIK
jgi:hypothetical protein